VTTHTPADAGSFLVQTPAKALSETLPALRIGVPKETAPKNLLLSSTFRLFPTMGKGQQEWRITAAE